MHDSELALVVRGGFPESRHRGIAVAVDSSGQVVAELGDSSTPILPRSTMKPFQAIATLRAGAALSGERLAIAAGSHDGSADHIATVRQILAAAGIDEGALGCPPAQPKDAAQLRELMLTGAEPRRIFHNCSGKHSGMLTACMASGYEPGSYLEPHHPYQQQVREAVTEMCGPISHTATDGCGAPVHAVTVRGLAHGYAKLAAHSEGALIFDAMRNHPVMVGGTTADDTRLMQLIPGIVAKRGAEGVFAVGTESGLGVVVKVSDGDMRPAVMVILQLLAALGINTGPAAALGHTAVLGGGLPVGEVRPSQELLRATQGA